MKNKIYKMMINKWDVELCAKTLNVSRRRVEKYLNALMKTALRDHHSLRMFWGDVNKLLKQADPQTIEHILSPIEEQNGGNEDELKNAECR